MKIGKSKFLADAIYNAVASAVASASVLVMAVTCARAFGSDQFGVYSYALAIASPVFLLGGMNLRQLIGSYPHRDINCAQFNGMQAVGLAIALVVAVTIAMWDGGRSEISDSLAIVLLVVAFKFFATAAEGRYGWLVREGRFRNAAIRKVQRGVVTAALFVTIAFLTESLQTALVAAVVSSAFLLVVHERGSNLGFELPTRALMTLGLISGLSATLDVLSTSLPRVALGQIGSFREVAHFSAVIQIPAIAAVVVGAIGNAAIPRWRTSEKAPASILQELLVIQGGVAGVSIALAIAAAIIGDWLIELIYGNEFGGLGALLLTVVFGSAFWFASGLNGCLLQAKGKYGWQLCSTSAAAITLVLVLAAVSILDGGLEVASAAHCYVAAMAARFVVSSVGVGFWLRSGS